MSIRIAMPLAAALSVALLAVATMSVAGAAVMPATGQGMVSTAPEPPAPAPMNAEDLAWLPSYQKNRQDRSPGEINLNRRIWHVKWS